MLWDDLESVMDCAQCGKRMTYSHGRKTWMCPQFHDPEPREEIYNAVCDIVDKHNPEREKYGLPVVAASLVVEAFEDGWDGSPLKAERSLFCQAVQVDELMGGAAEADKALAKYVAMTQHDQFRKDYEEFLRANLRGQAGRWPWKALMRAAEIGTRLGAQLQVGAAWDTVGLWSEVDEPQRENRTVADLIHDVLTAEPMAVEEESGLFDAVGAGKE